MSRLRSALTVAGSLCVLSVCAPSLAGAYATKEPPPNPSAASGLPDGRVYELVSPANKHAYEAGAIAPFPGSSEIKLNISVASPDGNAVAFGASGPAAELDASGLNQTFVAEHTLDGWKSRSTTGRGVDQTEGASVLFQAPGLIDYSRDLSHLVYETYGPQVPGAPHQAFTNFYLTGPDPFEQPTWLLREGSGGVQSRVQLAGMSPDASVIYIAYEGKLLEQDSSRSGWGVYEYRNGKLGEAGLLPDGSMPPTGAQPAAAASLSGQVDSNNPASLDNQVSEDGMRLFFVAGGELYVHIIASDGSERSVLVSGSQMPGHVGEPAPAGVHLFENLTKNINRYEGILHSAPTYAYASPDGSQVFFESEDQLTIGAPSGSGQKVYVYDVDTGSLEYLSGVELGGIVTAAVDGSSFIFVNNAATPELERWVAGPNGGSVTSIVQLSVGGFVGPGRLVANDSALIFQASAPIADFNDAGTEQVYRYDIKADRLGCLSCPPAGVKPSGDTYLSPIDQYDDSFNQNLRENQVVNDARGVSSDGTRVFFDSPDPLVGRDTNGVRDTYEWENGTVFLISSGTSPLYSLFLDNSESGGDVFFTTSDELVQGDNDLGFDVYDARVPHPGDNPPPDAVPCEGDVCLGPPSIAELLGPPPSATFNGAGNIVEEASATSTKSTPKRLSRTQRLASALRTCRKHKLKVKRSACKKQARRQYGTAAAATKHKTGRGK